jgi:dihydrofolate synthase / folylpolyglutamate synthase
VIYSEAIQFLYDLRLFGAKFGLENTFQLAALASKPQDRLRFIHVAGTNGKGSTCAMLESIYRSAGLRVGLFTSPHLVSFRERIQVNRKLISEQDVVRLVEEIQALQRSAGVPPASASDPKITSRRDACATFFEFVTVMALKFFAEQNCDLVIWETGLGGRLDATNIVTPLASVITNIQFDHQQWLGDTLAQIATEKAGIIKPGVPVITATDEPDALAVIEKMAREKNAPLIKINSPEGRRAAVPNQDQMGSPTLQPSRVDELSLLGDHQKLNAALALAVAGVLQNQIRVEEEKTRASLASVHWPGRLQLVTCESGRKILLDGAHNPAGAKALSAAVSSWSSGFSLDGGTLKRELQHAETVLGAPITLILGVLQDKDWQHICETLAPLAARVFTVPVSSERSANPAELAEACRKLNPSAEIAAYHSLADALDKSAADRFVIITGSLYLVGEALELLGLSPAGNAERGLNEWTRTPPVLLPG